MAISEACTLLTGRPFEPCLCDRAQHRRRLRAGRWSAAHWEELVADYLSDRR